MFNIRLGHRPLSMASSSSTLKLLPPPSRPGEFRSPTWTSTAVLGAEIWEIRVFGRKGQNRSRSAEQLLEFRLQLVILQIEIGRKVSPKFPKTEVMLLGPPLLPLFLHVQKQEADNSSVKDKTVPFSAVGHHSESLEAVPFPRDLHRQEEPKFRGSTPPQPRLLCGFHILSFQPESFQ